jgi:hypothetical protein
MTGIERLADSIKAQLEQLLPGQRKTQRGKLSLLVATMLDARSANLMDLPLEADRTNMRYQWITRFLANPLVDTDAVMAPFAPAGSGTPGRRRRTAGPDPGPVEDLGYGPTIWIGRASIRGSSAFLVQRR